MNNPNRSLFSLRLIALRKKQRLTQADMAEKLHVSRSTYTCYETGTSTPGLSTLSELATIFHVSTDYLLGGEDDPTPFAALRDSGLSREEGRLIECYRQLTPEKQHALLELVAAMIE